MRWEKVESCAEWRSLALRTPPARVENPCHMYANFFLRVFASSWLNFCLECEEETELRRSMPADDILLDCEENMEKTVEHLRHELRGVRTGRASPALVENIKVDYYGSPTDLRAISAISVPEATQILIKPFSPQDLKAIEKAINDSKIGLTPHSDGRQMRLVLPAMSQERRQQLVGQCKGFAEHAKITIRNA